MDEIILTLDYNNKNESTKIVSEYDVLKKSLDSEMIIWEGLTEDLLMINN